jgi:hypothetical protein
MRCRVGLGGPRHLAEVLHGFGEMRSKHGYGLWKAADEKADGIPCEDYQCSAEVLMSFESSEVLAVVALL